MKNIKRVQYLNKLKAFKDHELIKVVTGIRRSGKSTLLMQFQEYLRTIGVEDDQIVSINFEDFDFIDITDSRKLYEYIKPLLIEGKPMYLFFDEIQHVNDFQRIIDSLYIKPNIDILQVRRQESKRRDSNQFDFQHKKRIRLDSLFLLLVKNHSERITLRMFLCRL